MKITIENSGDYEDDVFIDNIDTNVAIAAHDESFREMVLKIYQAGQKNEELLILSRYNSALK